MMHRRSAITILPWVAIFVAAPMTIAPLLAEESGIVTAPDALRRLEAGSMILIDVRSEREWRETGIPRGALAISIHDPLGKAGFLEKVRAAIGDPTDRPIATICATGVRSGRTQTWLAEAGYTSVLNVREGMLGRRRASEPVQPGWLNRELPTEPWTGTATK